MKIKVTLLCLLFYSTFPSYGQKFNFEYHEIGDFGNRMGQTSLVDVDNDGDLDVVFGCSGDMYWWEYKSPTEWKLHEIGKGAKTDVGGCPHDVNNDGWIDFIVGDSWYENTGAPRNQKFILHRKNMIKSHDNIVVDIDGDGIKDVVSLSNDPDHPVLAWYKIPEDHTQNWDYTKIGDGIHGGIGPKGYGDLNKNGYIDIVRGDVWFENLDGTGKKWKRHEVLTPPGGSRPDKFGLAIKTWLIDLDNDGDLDIVQAEADTPNGRVFWWENVNNGESFIFHPISADSTGQDFHALAIADFDGDGDMDILSGGGPLTPGTPKLFIWENVAGDGSVWKEHEILSGIQVHEVVAADVDGDGDVDIYSKPWRGSLHIYLENKLIDRKKK
jgi:hypothetical protein